MIILNLLLLLAAAIAFIAINCCDREPSSDFIELQAYYENRMAINYEDNGYIFLMGFDVPQTEDPFGAGMQRIKWTHEVDLRYGKPVSFPGAKTDILESRIPLVKHLVELCKLPTRECMRELEANQDVTQKWLSEESWFSQRYSFLLTFKGWFESGKIDSLMPMPGYQYVMGSQRNYLIENWLQAKDCSSIDIVDYALHQELKFWRGVLKNTDSLITKMIAVAAINNNFYWGNLIFQKCSKKGFLAEYMTILQTPFETEEISLHRALIGEWVYLNSSLTLANREDHGFFEGKFFLHHQDTKNRLAKVVKDVGKSLDVDIYSLPQVIDQKEQLVSTSENISKFENLYNISGKILINLFSKTSYHNYAARVADLEGARRALLLMIQMRGLHLSSTEINSYIESSDLLNPYTQSPFIWDDKANELVFNGLETGERGRHAFPL